MRIANLVPGTGVSRFASFQVPQDLIAPDVEVEFIETGFFAEPRTPVADTLSGISFVAAAAHAERKGFDAAFINSAADYGLAEIHSAVRIPVVGAGTASGLLAASMVRRFAVVQVQPKSVGWVTERVLRAQGLTDRCCAIRHVSAEDEGELVFASMLEGQADYKAAMTDRICREMDAVIAEDGAEAIILGCTCMTGVVDELSRRSAVPVISPLHVAFKTAEQFVRLGLTTSTVGTDPDADRLAALCGQVNELMTASGDSSGNEVEACKVCAPVYFADEFEAESQPAHTTA